MEVDPFSDQSSESFGFPASHRFPVLGTGTATRLGKLPAHMRGAMSATWLQTTAIGQIHLRVSFNVIFSHFAAFLCVKALQRLVSCIAVLDLDSHIFFLHSTSTRAPS